MELIAPILPTCGWFYGSNGSANRPGLCEGIARSIREMRVAGDVSTGASSGDGDLAMPDAPTEASHSRT